MTGVEALLVVLTFRNCRGGGGASRTARGWRGSAAGVAVAVLVEMAGEALGMTWGSLRKGE